MRQRKEYGYVMVTRSKRIAAFLSQNRTKAMRQVNLANAAGVPLGLRKHKGPFRLARIRLRAMEGSLPACR